MSERWAPLAVIATATLWGTTGVASGLIPQENPVAIGAASVGIGGLILGLGSARSIRVILTSHHAFRCVALGALGLMLYMPLFYISVSLIGAALGTVISIGSGPLFAGILEGVLLRRRPTAVWAAAMAATVGGAFLLMISRADAGVGSPDAAAGGIAAGLIAGATYALYAFAIGQLLTPCAGRPLGLPHRHVVATIQAAAALPMLLVFTLTTEATFAGMPGASYATSLPVWPVLLYLAIVPTSIGHALFAFGLGRMDASKATLYTVLEPVVATVLAMIILGEAFAPAGWFGFPLVVGGLIAASVLPNRAPRTTAQAATLHVEHPLDTAPLRTPS